MKIQGQSINIIDMALKIRIIKPEVYLKLSTYNLDHMTKHRNCKVQRADFWHVGIFWLWLY